MRYQILIDPKNHYHLMDTKYNRISSAARGTIEEILDLREYSPIPNQISDTGNGYVWYSKAPELWDNFSTLSVVHTFESIEQFIIDHPEYFI